MYFTVFIASWEDWNELSIPRFKYTNSAFEYTKTAQWQVIFLIFSPAFAPQIVPKIAGVA